jgi:alpha-tubulin suppressor-like RCC1 family protein
VKKNLCGDGDTSTLLVAKSQFSTIGSILDIAVGLDHTIFLVDSGDVYTCGDDTNGKIGRNGDTTNPFKVLGFVSKIAAGRTTSYLLGSNTVLYTFGEGISDALGTPNQNSIFTPTTLISNITSMGVMSQSVYLYTTTGVFFSFEFIHRNYWHLEEMMLFNLEITPMILIHKEFLHKSL